MDWEETFRKKLHHAMACNAPKSVSGKFIRDSCRYAIACMKETMDELAEDEEGSSDCVVVAVDKDGVPYEYDFPWEKLPKEYLYIAKDNKPGDENRKYMLACSSKMVDRRPSTERADWWPEKRTGPMTWDSLKALMCGVELPRWWYEIDPHDSQFRRPPGR